MSDHSPDLVGYRMSCSQLNQLWHYDMWLAHILMDLPLRRCTAIPSELPEDFAPMDPGEFQTLKDQIRSMWISASHLFKCRKGDCGWGLFISEDFGKNGKFFTETKPLTMGWLAKAPSEEMCPTGHRYLRSPCANEKNLIYLGGPISLANFDEADMVIIKRHISQNEPLRNKLGMFKAPKRKLVHGQELLWSYNLCSSDRSDPSNFHPQNEWQLDECCSEVEVESNPVPMSDKGDKPSSKRRKVGGSRPHKNAAEFTSFKFCTYCGINVSSTIDAGKKENMKRHWALKHAVDLCVEMGADVGQEEKPVSAKDFVKHLDMVDHVYNSLNSMNYTIVPACNFFDITDTPLLPPAASEEEKEEIFLKFLEEGRTYFKKYQVCYLKGISMPKSYDDLLKPERNSNYSCVNWCGSKPSSNNFTLKEYSLTDDEESEHALDITSKIINAQLMWRN